MGQKKLTIVMAILAAMALGVGTAFAAIVVPNGDFEAGNTLFSSAYAFINPAVVGGGYAPPGPPLSMYDEGTYTVAANPGPTHINPSWASFYDHTLGTAAGHMMVVNGATNAPNVNVWTAPVGVNTLAVTIGQTYRFTAWLASLYPPPVGSSPLNAAHLQFSINGSPIGSDFFLTAGVGQWQEFFVDWIADGTGFANLSLININTAANGNDFALDDISLSAVPEPGTMMLLGSGLVGLAGWGRKKFRK